MNLFVLSYDHEECARFHNNSHVSKMILEGFQCLSTCHRWIMGRFAPEKSYKMSHVNHPVNIWLRESKENYDWTYQLMTALSKEFTYRYDKTHKSFLDLGVDLAEAPADLPSRGLTDFALAMPDYCKIGDAVDSYREYYRKEKQHLAFWKKRDIPEFMFN